MVIGVPQRSKIQALLVLFEGRGVLMSVHACFKELDEISRDGAGHDTDSEWLCRDSLSQWGWWQPACSLC